MKAVILAGGIGTRISEESHLRPKPMIEIGGKPILWHIMKIYANAGHHRFVLCLGYKGHIIREFFLNYRAMVCDFTIGIGRDPHTTFHGVEDLSENWSITCAETGREAMTGARVRKALKYIDSDVFCLTYGDGVADIDVQKLVAFHRSHGKIATVTAVRPGSRYGELVLDEKDAVKAFAEKPQVDGQYINGGYFVFDTKRIAPYLEGGDDLILERGPIEALVDDGQLVAHTHDGFWQAMDTYREWQALEGLWNSGGAPWAIWQR